MKRCFCILGGGLAGTSAAGKLREAGFEGNILLVSDEAEPPYDRPPLSKESLAGSADMQDIALREPDWYENQKIELVLGDGCISINRTGRLITLRSGRSIQYDRLLIATGTTARTLPGLEDSSGYTHLLRTAQDMRTLRKGLGAGSSLAIIGAGVIGLETAATARKLGCRVRVFDIADRVMARVVPEDISSYLENAHQENGVSLYFGAGDLSIDHKTVVSSVHGRFDADAILIGIGVTPQDGLARDCDLECNNGIIVSEFCRTSDQEIFAAGDVAVYPCIYSGSLVRSENWQHAKLQGECAALNMLGTPTPYNAVSSMWSDQYDIKLQLAGKVGGSEPVRRGDVASGRFLQFYLAKDGTLEGVLAICAAKNFKFAQKLIEKRAKPDASALRDPGVNLRKL